MFSSNLKTYSLSRNLSGGMQRRLLIAKALVHKPPIVILDEPTAGVDVELRKKLLENVKSLQSIGVTIILTTHYLSEAEEMCDRIAIINKGRLIALDTTENMLNKIQTKIVKFSVNKKVELIDTLKKKLKIKKKRSREIEVISGPYKSVNLLKNDYIKLKNIKQKKLDQMLDEIKEVYLADGRFDQYEQSIFKMLKKKMKDSQIIKRGK